MHFLQFASFVKLRKNIQGQITELTKEIFGPIRSANTILLKKISLNVKWIKLIMLYLSGLPIRIWLKKPQWSGSAEYIYMRFSNRFLRKKCQLYRGFFPKIQPKSLKALCWKLVLFTSQKSQNISRNSHLAALFPFYLFIISEGHG